jgi:hypothetical protein
MKTTIFIFLFVLSLMRANGQAVLEQSFPGEYINSAPVLLTTLGWVYPTIMYNSNITLKIYAEDYTLLRSIYLEIPTGYQYLGIYNLSDKLFNDDNEIEILYSMYNTAIHRYDMRLVNESGLLMQEFPNFNFAIVYQIEGVFKMYANDNYDSIGYVYGLPGTMLVTDNPILGSTLTSVSPNPCTQWTEIQYNLPESNVNTWLEIFSVTGTRMTYMPVTNPSGTRIDVSSFAAGEYLYSIKSGTQILSGGKFIKK